MNDPDRAQEVKDIMRPLIDDAPTTEAGALFAVLARLPAASAEVETIRSLIWKAAEVAETNGRPTSGYRALARDLDAIIELLGEKVLETVQKLAEAEACSRG